MSAKSVPAIFPGQFLAWLASATRQAVTSLILLASLVALLWVLENQHGLRILGTSYTRILVQDQADETVKATRAASPAEEARFKVLSEFLARRYKVSHDVTYDLVGIAHSVGRDVGLDPLLIISVMAVESRFNPIAESVVGAKGLMQVIPAYHKDKFEEFGGEKAVYDPETNIVVGAQILKEYFRRTGNLGIALQMYAGALKDENDAYSTRVFGEQQRLQSVLTQIAKVSPGAHPAGRRQPAATSPL